MAVVTVRQHGVVSVPVVLDCDPGHDDALALLLAVGDPGVELLAVTTVAGNQDVDTCWRNARRVLASAGADDVPVGRGADRPLRRPRPGPSAVHAASAFDGSGPSAGAADTAAGAVTDAESALAVTVRVLCSSPEPVTLVATGPLTNVARLLSRRPELRGRIAEVVWMGGSTGGPGLPAVETNASIDPEAADLVVRSGVPLTMCGLDVTQQAAVTPAVVAAFARIGTPIARHCVDVLTHLREAYRRERDTAQPPLHDPVALARVLDPSLVRCVPAIVDVDTGSSATAGTTRVRRCAEGAAGTTLVAVELDADRFWARLVSAVAGLSGSEGR